MKNNILLLCLFLFFSCSDKKNKNNRTENPILLKVGKEAEKSQFFKDYFQLETVLPIETTNEFLMADGIKRVISYKNKLIILDSGSAIFVVDYTTGKVETYIRKIGQGPGESRKIMDISFDEQTETIIAYNDYKHLLFYNLEGKFLKQEKFEKLFENIIYENGNILFYNRGQGYSCYPYVIEKYNFQNKTLKIIGENDKLDFPMRLYGRHIVKSKNIWFGTPFDFDLNIYTNSSIESRYRLNPETVPLTEENMMLATTDLEKFFTIGKTSMYGIGSIRETEHYLIFVSSKHGFFILNKETNEIKWENYVDETELGLKLLNYFPHDGDDSRIMFFVRPSEWLRRNVNEARMDNIPVSLKEKIDSFSIKEDNNPILIFYHEK